MDTKLEEKYEASLKKAGYSLTKPRRQIFKLLSQKEQQSVHELFIAGQGQFDRVSLYRTINLLEKLGIVNRVQVGWKYKLELSDMFTHHHHHLTCLNCGRVITIKEDNLENLIHSLSTNYQFVAKNHQLEIQGLCSDCQ